MSNIYAKKKGEGFTPPHEPQAFFVFISLVTIRALFA